MTRNTRRHKTIAYDPVGNRTVKEHGGGEAVWVNSKHAGTMTDTVTCSIYPNPYININGNRWTKHYYIGGERIASSTGTISGFQALNDTQNPPAGLGIVNSINYSAMRQAEEDSIDSMYARLGVPYRAHQTNTRGDGWHLYLPATQTEENVAGDSDRGYGGSHPLTLGDGQLYFYHRDHLGSTMSVTDSIGNTVQQVEYTPWGEVFVERCFGTSGFDTPYLFNGKELDEETGLYYYGARYYDPKMSVWYSTDPMELDYPWVTTYGYCMNNPVKLYDLNGEDWYQDEDGTLQYNPDVHSQRNLKGNQLYKFSERNYQKHGVHYRKDGSILYKNETDAYNRIWNQADVHYRNKGEVGGREIGGFILSNGNVLVLPDYQNDSRTAKISAYGYIINGSKLTKGKESFSILGQIHTHQEKTVEVNPSYYLVNSYGDLDISIAMNGKPVITIAHDGFLYALRGGKLKILFIEIWWIYLLVIIQEKIC